MEKVVKFKGPLKKPYVVLRLNYKEFDQLKAMFGKMSQDIMLADYYSQFGGVLEKIYKCLIEPTKSK